MKDPKDVRTSIAIRRAWTSSASERTVLYYAYLLSRGSSDTYSLNIYKRLEEVVSLEDGTFQGIIDQFHKAGIITEVGAAALTPVAQNVVESLIVNDLGKAHPVRLDGLKIHDAPDNQRHKLWVEAGCSYVKEIFGRVKGIKFSEKPMNPSIQRTISYCTKGFRSTFISFLLLEC